MTTGGRRLVLRKRHPRGLQLTAWHDGELNDPLLSAHIESCARCWRAVATMTKVDAAVRGSTVDQGVAGPSARRVRRLPSLTVGASLALVVAAVVVMLAPAVSIDASKTRLFGRPAADRSDVLDDVSPPGSALTTSTAVLESDADRPTARGAGREDAAPSLAAPPPVPRPSPTSGEPPPPAAIALRIGLPLPGGERSTALDTADILRSARSALEAANGAGGIGGRPIELQVLDADALDVSGVDVLAGGLPGRSGVETRGRLWILPADPQSTGSNVLGVLPAAADYGRLIAEAWTPAGEARTFILQDGSEQQRIADAFSAKYPAAVRLSVDDRCEESLGEARGRGASSLVLALDRPALEGCAAALRRIGWVPSGQLLVPGYVAFGASPFASAADVRALLGVPWPAWDETGPARFRQATKSLSYRALVTFASVELAVAVARANAGQVNAAALLGGAWRSDLLALDGTTNVGLRPARMVPGGWVPDPQ